MAKTVTVRKARTGRRYITAGGTRFPVGEPVRDVDDPTIEQLKRIPGVEVHVAGPRNPDPTTDPDPAAPESGGPQP
jgi:hypothetical protein